jgi:hypothetical protein
MLYRTKHDVITIEQLGNEKLIVQKRLLQAQVSKKRNRRDKREENNKFNREGKRGVKKIQGKDKKYLIKRREEVGIPKSLFPNLCFELCTSYVYCIFSQFFYLWNLV